MLSNSSSFSWFFDEWVALKKKAKATQSDDDWDMYEFFLKEAETNFRRVYLQMTKDNWVELIGNILTLIKDELKLLTARKIEKEIPF